MVVVADSGPLIVLPAIGHLGLLRDVYGRVWVPAEVHREVVIDGAGKPGSVEIEAADWIVVASVMKDVAVWSALTLTLDPGEAAALALATQMGSDLLLVDDRRARQTAQRMGLAVKGALGVLVTAKRAGIIPVVAPLLEAIDAHGYWLSDALRERVLGAVDEPTGV